MTLSDRFWAKVDKSDGCWLWTGALDNRGYGKINAGGARGRTLCAHRVAWELSRGEIPAGLEVDHTCMVRNCVRPDHMRLATRKQNNEHRHTESDLPRGVSRHHTGKWRVRVKHRGREVSGGLFVSVDDASEAARILRNRLFTHNDCDRLESAGVAV